MKDAVVNFDSAPLEFARLLVDCLGAEAVDNGRILRDVYGRLSFVTRCPSDARYNILSQRAAEVLGAYSGSPTQIVASLSDDISAYSELADEPSVGIHVPGQIEFRMIDRRIAGGEWLMRPEPLANSPRRLIFHSVKGGVGRSTALAIAAADLAAQGYNALVIDMDLEAPGLGTLLLRAEDVPTYGVADWFAAIAAGADAESLIPDMAGSSPFTSSAAVVDVIPAAGREPGAYMSKLARAYMPGSAGEQYAGLSFPKKTAVLVNQLLSRRNYDAVLIDARAGLHETSGGLLLGLGARVLLFGVDADQTFDDYKIMLGVLAQALDPAVGGEDIRSAFKMVHAKAPKDEKDRKSFREQSWEAWGLLYDAVDPEIDAESELSSEAFVFDLNDESAPHYPLEITGDESYTRFNPRTQTYPMSAYAYSPVFGNFLAGVYTMLGLQR